MPKSCSLKDIAEACGLSISTVSQILKGSARDYSSEETRRKVHQTARDLGYRVNFGYRLMRGQKTRTVAIMASMLHMKSEEHIRELIVTLMTLFEQKGFAAYFGMFTNNPVENLDKIRELTARGVEHFVILGSPVGHQEIEDAIESAEQTYISTSRLFRRWIAVDIAGGIEAILRHFQTQVGDHFRMAILRSQIQPDNVRMQPLLRCFPEMNFETLTERFVWPIEALPEEMDLFSEHAFRAGREVTARHMLRNSKVKAIMYMNDNFAVGGADFLINKNLIPGRDILLGGVNNIHAVQSYPYPISSVGHGWLDRAHLLAEEVLNHTECQIELPPVVRIRKQQV